MATPRFVTSRRLVIISPERPTSKVQDASLKGRKTNRHHGDWKTTIYFDEDQSSARLFLFGNVVV
jgi:hypothetical protein